jgi:hypothetical protein
MFIRFISTGIISKTDDESSKKISFERSRNNKTSVIIKKMSSLPGLEPGIFRFEVERVIHYATGPCDESYLMN